MTVAIVVIPLLILAFALCIAVPTVIGVYVYKDAKRRSMNPVLWTLIAVLAPGFIGLIIYLIIRSNYSEKNCPQCGKRVHESFSVCPSCGYSLKNRCPNCSMPLEPDWNICPNCANPVPPEMRPQNPVKPKKDKGLKIILALVIIIPLLLCALIVGGIAAYRNYNNINFSGFMSTVGTYVDDKTVSIICPEISVTDWYSQCDEEGEGVYILRAVIPENESRYKTTKLLVYRNDGYYTPMLTSHEAGGLFTAPTALISFDGMGDGYFDALPDDFSITYFEFEDCKDYSLEVYTNGEITDVTIMDVSDIYLGFNKDSEFLAELEIPIGMLDDYWFNVNLFYEGEQISSGGSHGAGPLNPSGSVSIMYFSMDRNHCLTADEITVSLSDEDGNVLAESGRYPLWDENGNLNDYYRFTLASVDGKMAIVYKSDVYEESTDPSFGVFM